MPRISDRWSGTASVLRRHDRWDGSVLKQLIHYPGSVPGVVAATNLNDRFDPRLGGTGTWLGADVARSVPFGDGRFLWLFADTYKRVDGGTGAPTTRSGSAMVNDSLALQSGPDLATATLTFRFAPTGDNWFPISSTHISWPMDAVFIGNDLYVFSMRVLRSNPLGGEYGWAVHRIANAKTLAFTSWPTATLLYASGDTASRPLWSPYDGNDGYVYVFGIKRHYGWFWARWLKTNLVGSAQRTVEYFNAYGWTTDASQAFVFAENAATSEGSFHRRPVDGRWLVTESIGDFPLLKGSIRMAAEKEAGVNGSYYVSGGPLGYLPTPPPFSVGDHVKDDGGFDAVITGVNADGSRIITYYAFWGGNTATKPLAQLTSKPRSDRWVYENPRNYEVPLPPQYHTYAYKAHPGITAGGTNEGLLVSFVDNGVLGAPLDVYTPEFYWVLPPKLSAVKVTTGGVVTWVPEGQWDRMMVRHKAGAWVELAPDAVTTTVSGYVSGDAVEVRAIGAGGDVIVAATL